MLRQLVDLQLALHLTMQVYAKRSGLAHARPRLISSTHTPKRHSTSTHLLCRAGGEVPAPLPVRKHVVQRVHEVTQRQRTDGHCVRDPQFEQKLAPVVIGKRHIAFAMVENGNRLLKLAQLLADVTPDFIGLSLGSFAPIRSEITELRQTTAEGGPFLIFLHLQFIEIRAHHDPHFQDL